MKSKLKKWKKQTINYNKCLLKNKICSNQLIKS